MSAAQLAAILIAGRMRHKMQTERHVADEDSQQQRDVAVTIHGWHVFSD